MVSNFERAKALLAAGREVLIVSLWVTTVKPFPTYPDLPVAPHPRPQWMPIYDARQFDGRIELVHFVLGREQSYCVYADQIESIGPNTVTFLPEQDAHGNVSKRLLVVR